MRPSSEKGVSELLENLSLDKLAVALLALTVLRLLLLLWRKQTVPGQPSELHPIARGIAEVAEAFLVAGALVFFLIRPFFFQAFFIPTGSMENTLLGHDAGDRGYTDTVHDNIFVNKLVYRTGDPQRGDIVVFRAPKEADMENDPPVENTLIKRCMGVPGDTILIDADGVHRSGKLLKESYIKEPMNPEILRSAVFAVGKSLTLGPRQYFMMGDNRNNSNDSRYWGVVSRERVIGKAQMIFLPFSRIRFLRNDSPVETNDSVSTPNSPAASPLPAPR